MAYLTCPDCMMPNSVGDDAIKYACMSCYAEIVFETCHACAFKQSIPSRWMTAYTCGYCEAKNELPRRRMYSTSTKAIGVRGYGYVYPKM